MFDQTVDPWFIFFPVDIAFFIRAELKDRERRNKEGGRRIVPSADEYRRHQEEQGQVPATAEGGLYFRCFLHEYMHVGYGFSARQAFGEPVVYHGAPFGAFYRAFRALGSPRAGAMSIAVIEQLSLLKTLYYMEEDEETLGLKDDDINPPALKGPYVTSFNLPPSFDNTRPMSNNNAIRCLKKKEDDDGKDLEQDHNKDSHTPSEEEEVILGPELSTNDIIQRYRPVIEASMPPE